LTNRRDHDKETPLRLTDLRLDRRHFRTRGYLAAVAAGRYRRVPTMHGHLMGAFGLACCGQAWQEAGQNRRHRPKQDGANRHGHANSAHSHQFELLGGFRKKCSLYGAPAILRYSVTVMPSCDCCHKPTFRQSPSFVQKAGPSRQFPACRPMNRTPPGPPKVSG
jgi:hypothetical protein